MEKRRYIPGRCNCIGILVLQALVSLLVFQAYFRLLPKAQEHEESSVTVGTVQEAPVYKDAQAESSVLQGPSGSTQQLTIICHGNSVHKLPHTRQMLRDFSSSAAVDAIVLLWTARTPLPKKEQWLLSDGAPARLVHARPSLDMAPPELRLHDFITTGAIAVVSQYFDGRTTRTSRTRRSWRGCWPCGG